jgi:hypothetical protein
MNGRLCDIERNWNLGHHIKLSMHLNAGLGTSEPSPFKKRHAKIYSSGIKGIVFSVELKLLINTLLLGKFYNMISKLFKDMVITDLIYFGELRSINWCLTKTKVKRLIGMCRSNIRQFTKAITAIQLTEHENQQLVPICQIPSFGFVVTFFHDKSFKVSFGKEIGDLTEKIFAAVHCTLLFGSPAKVDSSKVRQGFWQYAC